MKMNALEPILMRWMNLEPIIQCEVSQKEKYKYHILIHIMGSKKVALMNLFSGQQWRNRSREQTMDMEGGEEGEGEMYGGNNIEIYNTVCIIDSQWEFAV